MIGHRSIGAAFFIVAGLAMPACADDTDEYLDYTVLTCHPNSEIACACPGDNGRGVARCRVDGSGYEGCGSCTGPGKCTVFPNCDGCVSCIDQCLCQSSESDPAACEARCPEPETGGAGGTGGRERCVVSECPQPMNPLAQTCCTQDNACGFLFSLLSPNCIEGNQPGAADPACPQVTAVVLPVPGCCRPDGRCGALDTFIGFGCADPRDFGQPAGPRCDAPR